MRDETSQGLALKERGQAAAISSKSVWAEEAEAYLVTLAEWGQPFTSEDLTHLAGLPSQTIGMNANNAVGAVISGAARKGLIEPIGYAKSKRKSSHGAVLRVWRGVQ